VPPSSDDISQLQQEWRAIVLAKLDALEKGQKDTIQQITSVQIEFARTASVERLAERVTKIEDFKSRTIGIVIAINTILGVTIALIEAFKK
jgi:hypothetical protein